MTIPPMRRVYYFTPPNHAIENLQKKRLKVARFSQCNDPFELASFSQKNKLLRRKFEKWLKHMDENYGLLCFCKTWRNPVMWAHYAKNHTGVCYGFDVDPELLFHVRYVSKRLYPDLNPSNFLSYVKEDRLEELIATKFIHWSYEEEARMLIKFPQKVADGRRIFEDFSEDFALREVIVGVKSEITASEVQNIVSEMNVEVFKARPAFQTFEIVRQKNKALW